MRNNKERFLVTLKSITKCNKVYREKIAKELKFESSKDLITTFRKAVTYLNIVDVCVTLANNIIKESVDVPMAITFKKTNGEERYLIGHFVNVTNLGTLRFRDYQDYRTDNYKEINPKNIISFTVNNTFYKVKSK